MIGPTTENGARVSSRYSSTWVRDSPMLWVKKIEPASDTVRQASPTDAAAWVTASRPNGFSAYVRGSRVTIAAARLRGAGLASGRSAVHPTATAMVTCGVVRAVAGVRTVRLVDPEPPTGVRRSASLPARGSGPRSTRLPGRIAPERHRAGVGTMHPMERTRIRGRPPRRVRGRCRPPRSRPTTPPGC